MSSDDLASRLHRLEAQGDIRALVAQYCFAIDDHDLETVARLFTTEARVWSSDGVIDAVGRDAIIGMYEDRFRALGPSNHVSHDHLIRFDSGPDFARGPDVARGLVSAHAELHRNDTPMITALRYRDLYRRDEGIWRFAERELSFLYYVPLTDYPGILAQPDRMRAYGDRRPADYPESLPGWKDYRDA